MKKQIIAIVCGLACLLGTAGCGSAAGEAKQEKSEAKSEASRTVTEAEDKAEDKAENKTEEKTEDKSPEESKSLVSAATPLDNKKSTETVPLSEDTRYQELRQYIIDNFEGDESLKQYRLSSGNMEINDCTLLDELKDIYVGYRSNYPDITNEQYMKLLQIRKEHYWSYAPFEEAVVLGTAKSDQPRITLEDTKRIIEEAEKLPLNQQSEHIQKALYKIHPADESTQSARSNLGYVIANFYLSDTKNELIRLFVYPHGVTENQQTQIDYYYITVHYVTVNAQTGEENNYELLFNNYPLYTG